MKRLLIGLTYYSPNISGVTIYAQLLAENMAKLGFEVRVICSRPKGLKKIEVVNCHLPQIESVVLAIWAKIFRKKLIVTHHCEFGFTGTLSNKLISVISFPFHFVTYLLADRIVSYTKDYAQNSIFLKIFKNKIEYILPPVEVGKEDNKKIIELRKKIKLEKNEKIVGYVGRIAWEKGLDHLVKAVELIGKNRKVKLVLVGPYSNVAGDESGKKLIKLIERNKSGIVLYGPMSHHADLVNFYKICDCLVLPSTDNLETFGIVQAEAMISGCPVVASDLPGVRMPIKMTGLGEIAKIGDFENLAKKIELVLKTKYSQDKFDGAKKLFSIDKFKKDYIKLFNEI